MKIGSIIKDSLILFAITLVLGLALSGTKVATQDAIDKANLEAKIKAYNEVCPGYSEFEDITGNFVNSKYDFAAKLNPDKAGNEGVIHVKDNGGNYIGYITQVTSKGFGGALNLIVGFDNDGNVTGVKYANTPSETPGVGMKTTKPDFLGSWVGKNTTDVANVDTISGATISSTAFREAMRLACQVVADAKNQ